MVSRGCESCYAMKQAHRFSGPGKPYAGLTELGPQGPRWNGKIRLVPEALEEPIHWKKPRRVFVNSMSDLFHEDVPFEFIDRVFETICACRGRHTFQILTKRPSRMLTWCELAKENYPGWFRPSDGIMDLWQTWLGVSVEDQATADECIPILIKTSAAVRWISAEPLLGPVDLSRWFQCGGNVGPCSQHRPSWIVVGGESGPGARPCDLAWIRSIKDQCQADGVPVFVKQLGKEPRGICNWKHHESDPPVWLDENGTLLSVSGAKIGDLCHAVDDFCGICNWWPCKPKLKDKKGGDISEFPMDLRVREFPNG